RAELPVVISKKEPRQASIGKGRGSFVRRFASTENRIIYPPTLVRTEKACSMAESSKRKEKRKDFSGEPAEIVSEERGVVAFFRVMLRFVPDGVRGFVITAARTEDTVTIHNIG
ncbi:MAG: hypothetical protein IJD26_02590, partial [Lachnospiraceae bacterium]|nr:hypothetical protein [Lachnospiraceae bacterium]